MDRSLKKILKLEEKYDIGAGTPTGKVLTNDVDLKEKLKKDYLKDLREFLGISIKDATKHLGISDKQLKELEKGNVIVDASFVLFKASELYGVDYGKLMELYGVMKRKPTAKEFKIAASDMGGDLSKEELKAVQDFASSLFNKLKKNP